MINIGKTIKILLNSWGRLFLIHHLNQMHVHLKSVLKRMGNFDYIFCKKIIPTHLSYILTVCLGTNTQYEDIIARRAFFGRKSCIFYFLYIIRILFSIFSYFTALCKTIKYSRQRELLNRSFAVLGNAEQPQLLVTSGPTTCGVVAPVRIVAMVE